jgi:hypothetical protein
MGCGYLAVSDGEYENVEIFNSAGTYLYNITPPLGPNVYGMAMDGNGELYVTDWLNSRVDGYYLTPTGATFDYSWTGQGALSGPDGVKIDANGNLVVADWNNSKIYNLNWVDDSILNQTGTANLNSPSDVTLDPSGNIYVANVIAGGHGQVVKFDSGYNYVSSFDGTGWTYQFTPSVLSVGMDSQGNLFIVDNGLDRVVYATTQGAYLGEIDGFTNLGYLALDKSDDLFVADSGAGYVYEYTR